MRNLLFGFILGIGANCWYRRMKENGQLEQLTDEANQLAAKTKKKIKDAIDARVNQAEYLKERTEYKIEKGMEDCMDNL